MSKILLSTAYLPPIEYFATILACDGFELENHEHYIKQSYRNRCKIMTSNGILDLSIPVNKVNGNHTLIKDIRISYLSNWQSNHWRAIESAYNKSPFFCITGMIWKNFILLPMNFSWIIILNS